jgi:D-aminopeptidase
MASTRPRLRELGLAPGILPTGPLNAITDVEGIRVGHFTLIQGDSIRTGATAVLAHPGNLFQDKIPAGLAVGNGFGKLMGSTQIDELGEVETPILLTNTLAVPRAAEAILDWTLTQPGNEEVRSINPIVAETNDGYLNDIRCRALTVDMFRQAIESAQGGPVAEGSVGAGTGTMCFGWKGGIGSSSRRLPYKLGGYTLGALVQTNFGGILQLCGIPVGLELGQYYLKDQIDKTPAQAGGSIVMLIATDAPLSASNLRRLASRAMGGLARTGAALGNSSGDYAIAFSTHLDVRRTSARRAAPSAILDLPNDLLSPLFLATQEAVEEAIGNSLLQAETMTGYLGRHAQALPVDEVQRLVSKYHHERKV